MTETDCMRDMEQQHASPLRLYIHIPYCIHKCHYCDFNSHAEQNPDWENYFSALRHELDYWYQHDAFQERKIASIFIGGGTPSLAPATLIADLIKQTESTFGLMSETEITLEANPGSADAEHFKAYHNGGVNRLSMGFQSLDDRELRWLERIHDHKQALTAFSLAREAGFNNINLDMIYGLPGQSLGQWQASLSRVIDLGSEHLSCYQLTVEPHTRLAVMHQKSHFDLPEEQLALDFLHETRAILKDAGFTAYEVSNFAKKGLYCRHNDGYWLYDDYIGIGAGAAGKWDLPINGETGAAFRYSNIKTPQRYIDAVQTSGFAYHNSETISRQTAAAEMLWLGLRRTDGMNRLSFRERFGVDAIDHFNAELEPWISREDVLISQSSIRLTQKGIAMADAIASALF